MIVDEGDKGLWKLLTGDVEQDVYTGPHYPNASTNEISATFVGHCGNGCESGRAVLRVRGGRVCVPFLGAATACARSGAACPRNPTRNPQPATP